MPGSDIHGKMNIKEWFDKQSDIKTVIDVGSGSATYPKLLGNKYEYIGIEIWAPYVEQWGLQKYYKKIIIGDIRYIRFQVADCIILGDVIEHLPKEDGLQLIQGCLRYYKHVVLSIPLSEKKGEIVRGAIHYGNPFESHISAWTNQEVLKLFKWKVCIESSGIGVFIK